MHLKFFPSHNPQGIQALVSVLIESPWTFDQLVISFSKRPLDDCKNILRQIMIYRRKYSRQTKVWVCPFDHPKALPLNDMKLVCQGEEVEIFDPQVHKKRDISGNVLALGSNYLIHHLLKLFELHVVGPGIKEDSTL